MSSMKNKSKKCKEASGHCTHSCQRPIILCSIGTYIYYYIFIYWNFEEKNKTANFRYVPTQRNVILKIEISNDNSCAGSPPSNSNSDNSSFSEKWNLGKFEFKNRTSVPAKGCENQGLERWSWPSFSVLLPNNHFFRGS